MCQMAGYDTHQYTNIRYPFPFDPPYVPQDIPCGAYVHNFEYSRDEKASKAFLNFEGYLFPGHRQAESKGYIVYEVPQFVLKAVEKFPRRGVHPYYDDTLPMLRGTPAGDRRARGLCRGWRPASPKGACRAWARSG